jgi:hypothetical protein
MSAYNFWGAQAPIKLAAAGTTILAYLDKHCRDHPLGYVTQGVDALIVDLGGYRFPAHPAQ